MRFNTRLKLLFRQRTALASQDCRLRTGTERGLHSRSSGRLFIILLFALGGVALAESHPGDASGFSSTVTNRSPKELSALERRVKPILAEINLNDAVKAARVRDILVQHMLVLNNWHQKHDGELKNLWAQFSQAKAAQNQIKVDTALDQIEGVYASLKPQRAAFLQQLSEVLSASQADRVLDSLTANKVHVIFNNYGEIFHDLNEEQKGYIMRNLKAAREEAIDAGSMQEKSAIFKKFRMRIDAYLAEQGYDVKQAYRDFNAKMKAQRSARRNGGDSVANEDSE